MPKRLTQGPLDAALALLAARGRSRHEVDQALERRGHDEAARRDTLARLETLGYLDDARFARDRALALLRDGKHGTPAVRQRLLRHGLPEALVEEALQWAEGELGFDPAAAARAVLEQRGLLPAEDRKAAARAAHLLLRRGFPDEIIRALLPTLDEEAGAAALDRLGQED